MELEDEILKYTTLKLEFFAYSSEIKDPFALQIASMD